MLLALLSPSKTLRLDTTYSHSSSSTPELLGESRKVHRVLKELTPKKLEGLMSISPKLAKLNHERFQTFSGSSNPKNGSCALLTYSGDVYEGFELEDYTVGDFRNAQKSIRIISGLYGLLKPLDNIQPYRLEMKTRVSVNGHKDLYQLWGTKITDVLNKHIKEEKIKCVVNLASQEYAKAICFESIQAPLITIDFKDKKNGKLKTVGLFAKKARGRMANYIIRNKIRSPQELKDYRLDSYSFSKRLSDESNYVFIR